MASAFKKRYEEHLQSDKWKAIRKTKAEEQHYTCESCGKVVLVGFHIHHKTYKNLGNEPLSDLMFLCEDCHKQIHIELNAKKNAKKKKSNRKTCANCLFSKKVKHKGARTVTVLYCSIFNCECFETCNRYIKSGVQPVKKKKKTKRRKRKAAKRTK